MAELPTINLPRAQRGILVGCVGSGKSTLGTELVRRFLQDEPRALVGLIDSKPRYRAEWSINGTRMRYHDWAAGDTLAGSVALHHAREFPQARLQSRCLILQSLYPNRQLVEDFEEEASAFAYRLFRASSSKQPTLLYLDELYDLAHGQSGIIDRRLLRVIRTGRELNMGVLVGAQRPRSIPIPTLTESNRIYCFQLDYLEDIKYLRQHAVQLSQIPNGHAFVMATKGVGKGRTEQLLELNLRRNGGNGNEARRS
jgi:hypothetical protein